MSCAASLTELTGILFQHNLMDQIMEMTDKATKWLDSFKSDESCDMLCSVLARRGLQLHKKGEFQQAAELLGRVLERRKRIEGIPGISVVVASVMNRYVSALNEAGQLEEAFVVLCELTNVREQQYREQATEDRTYELALSYFNKGFCLAQLDRRSEALEVLRYGTDVIFGMDAKAFKIRELRARLNALKEACQNLTDAEGFRTKYNNARGRVNEFLKTAEGLIRTAGSDNLASNAKKLAEVLSELKSDEMAALFPYQEDFTSYALSCSMMFRSLGSQSESYDWLRLAEAYSNELIDTDDPGNQRMRAAIFTNLSSSTEGEEQESYCLKSIEIRQKLLNEGELGDEHELAMSCFNYAILLFKNGELKRAGEYSGRAYGIWYNLVTVQGRKELSPALDECMRLRRMIEKLGGL